MLFEYLEYDDCQRIFGIKGSSPDGYLSEYGDINFAIQIH